MKSQPGWESRLYYESMWWGIWPSQEVPAGLPGEGWFIRDLRDSGSEPRKKRVPTEGTACGEPFSISEHSMVEDLYEGQWDWGRETWEEHVWDDDEEGGRD